MGQGIAPHGFDACSGSEGSAKIWPTGSARGVSSASSKAAAVVALNIYDGAPRATVSQVLHGGAPTFHCGVQVNGNEWSFGAAGKAKGSEGVYSYTPGKSDGRSCTESRPIGTTALDEKAVLMLIAKMKMNWPASAYDAATCNCGHFCNELCRRLGLGGIPQTVIYRAGGRGGDLRRDEGFCFCCREQQLGEQHHVQVRDSCSPPHRYLEPGDEFNPEVKEAAARNMKRQLQQAMEELQQAKADLIEERAAHEEAVQMLAKLTYVVREAAQESAGKCSL